MNNLKHWIAVVGTMVILAGCGGDDAQSEGRVEIPAPVADLAFDEAFVKDRDIHLQMPEDIVLGEIGSIVVDAKGNLIVLDSVQWRVFQTDAEGRYQMQIGARGGAENEYFYVVKMLLGSNRDLYIQSVGESIKYLVFDRDSYKFKKAFPDPIFPTAGFIDRIAFTEGGNIYASQVDVTDGGTSEIREDGKHALFRLNENLNKIGTMYPVEDTRTAAALNRFHNTILTPRTGGGFYFMYPTIYEIHQYNEQGELEQTLFSDYRSRHRDWIKPFPTSLDVNRWTPKHEEWVAEHIIRFQLYECDPNLLVLVQCRREIGGELKYYLNLLYKDGYSVADGIRVPTNHKLLTVNGHELYFVIEGAFDEETGEAGDPYVAVYQLNDHAGAGKVAFRRGIH